VIRILTIKGFTVKREMESTSISTPTYRIITLHFPDHRFGNDAVWGDGYICLKSACNTTTSSQYKEFQKIKKIFK
jgi:hypothetical protein